jgi:hypothetical protein
MKYKLISIYTEDDERLIVTVRKELEKKYPQLIGADLSRAYLIQKIIDYALGIK